MTYIPPTTPPSSNYIESSIVILQYPNQQIISSNIPFSLRDGAYNVIPSNEYYNDGAGGGLWPDFLLPILHAGNNIPTFALPPSSSILTEYAESGLMLYWCTGDAPTPGGYFDSFDSHSIYKYDSSVTYAIPQTYPNNQNNWTKVTTLEAIGAGARFEPLFTNSMGELVSVFHLWDGTKILKDEIPVSASLSGSGGFLQVSGSIASGVPKGRISLMCVATASNDESGGVWMVTDISTQAGVVNTFY